MTVALHSERPERAVAGFALLHGDQATVVDRMLDLVADGDFASPLPRTVVAATRELLAPPRVPPGEAFGDPRFEAAIDGAVKYFRGHLFRPIIIA